MRNNIHIKNFNEHNINNIDIIVKLEQKNIDTYNFIKKYLNIIDYIDYINNDNLYQVVAYKNNKFVGLRIFKMKDNKIHLNYSAVIESERGNNINQLMFKKIEDIAINNNINLITSNVRKNNIASINSLLKSGFNINDKVKLYYPDGEKKISMYKKL